MRSKIKQIAQTLGIATSSVSRALSGKPGVSGALRDKVRALAGNVDYSPNPHAAALRTGRKDGIALVTIQTPTHITMLRNRAVIEQGQKIFGSVRIFLSHPDDPLDKTVALAASYSPRAIVMSSIKGGISPSLCERLRSLETPLVSLDSVVPATSSIMIDRRTGAYQAARLLLLSGCRHPVFFSPVPHTASDPRIEGITWAYRSLGRKASAEDFLIYQNRPDISPFETGYENARKILGTRPCDGMFCYNDEIAFGALKALSDADVKVPADIKVIGFDNLPFSGFTSPSLTTVAQPVDEPAEAAMEMCAAKPSGKELALKVFKTGLIVRDSAPILSNKLREKVFRKINFK